MKKVPKQTPRTIARIEYSAPRPRAGPVKPVTMVVSTKLPVNQNGAWCQTFAVTLVAGNVIDRTHFDLRA